MCRQFSRLAWSDPFLPLSSPFGVDDRAGREIGEEVGGDGEEQIKRIIDYER